MKVYTRRGDAGETDLFGGERVATDHLRVEAAAEEIGLAGVAATRVDLHGAAVRGARRRNATRRAAPASRKTAGTA